jgi:hypothetical protein
VVPAPIRLDSATRPLHRGLHRVHADAAARQGADRLGGREAGQEDQLDGFLIGQFLQALRRQQTALLRGRANMGRIDAAAVVAEP